MRRTLGYLLSGTLLGAQMIYDAAPVAGRDWVGDGGPALQALLFQAEGVAADPAGNVYVADAAGHRVRRITPQGRIQTVAGTGRAGFSGDGGPAEEAQLHSPYGLTLSPSGTLYIADLGNARVRRVDPDGTISTVVGSGLVSPRNLALDSAGNLYISDFGAHRVYRRNAAGTLDRVAGTGMAGFSGEGGPATLAMLSYPAALAIDSQNALYIADSQNHLVRKVAGGLIRTVAEAATPTGLAFDRFGTLHVADAAAGLVLRYPAAAQAAAPLKVLARDIAFGPGGQLYAASGAVVRQVQPNGSLSVLAGGGNTAFGDFGPAIEARLNHPAGVAADTSGNLYIADRDNHRVRKVTPEGVIVTVAGTGMPGDGGDGGVATRASLNGPVAVAVDQYGNLFIADQGNHRVRMVTPGGIMLPVAPAKQPSGLAVDRAGLLYVADQAAGEIYRADSKGAQSVIQGLDSPVGLAIDHAGNLYFTEPAAKRVRKRTPAGLVTSVGAGQWSEPRGLAVSESGGVFIADTGLLRVIHVDESGTVTPVDVRGSIGAPWGIAAGSSGVLYLAEADENRVQSLAPRVLADSISAIEALNAASLQPGPVAPGMLLAIRGGSFKRPTATFHGLPAPMLAVRDRELVVQAPIQIAAVDSVLLEILDDGTPRAAWTLPVAPAAPALFTAGAGLAIAANEDGSLNSPANPAARGSILVLYGTGQGLGHSPSSVRIGDYDAEVLYVGPVAGYPGLCQLNVRLPSGYAPPGTLGIVWTVGDSASQPGVGVAMK